MRHALATLLGTVQRTVRSHALIGRGDRVLAAVSGGPDSIGLLLILDALRHKLGFDLVAAHVNHRLRGADADLDEACAAETAARLGLPFVRAELPPALARGGNLEARARRLRYRALAGLALEQGCRLVATGHTLDDQAETVMMRLIRGSGGRGLAAIRPRRGDGVIRPLLDCRRAAVAAVVEAAGLTVRHDASNRDPRFLRTHVRERVLPLLAELNPSIATACANLAAAAGAESAIVDAWAARELEECAGGHLGPPLPRGAGHLGEPPPARAPCHVLSVRRVRRLDGSLRPLLVRHWLMRAGVPRRRLAARHVGSVVGLIDGQRGNVQVALPGGWMVRRTRDALSVERGVVADDHARHRSGARR